MRGRGKFCEAGKLVGGFAVSSVRRVGFAAGRPVDGFAVGKLVV